MLSTLFGEEVMEYMDGHTVCIYCNLANSPSMAQSQSTTFMFVFMFDHVLTITRTTEDTVSNQCMQLTQQVD